MKERVFVIAVGGISGNGSTMKEIYTNMFTGQAARNKIWHFPIDDPKFARSCATKEGLIDTVCGSPLTNEKLFQISGFEGRAHRFDRHQLFAFVAAQEALGSNPAAIADICSPNSFGIMGATGNGGLTETYVASLKLEAGEKLDPYANVRELPNTFTGMIANYYGIKGPGDVGVTACAAGSNAFINAVRTIRLGEAKAILVVGTEAVINPFGIASFASQRAISNQSRPYQQGRLGFLMGEGAAAALLVSEETLRACSARPLAEVVGYGSTTDGKTGGAITAPDSSGGARSAMAALRMAGVDLDGDFSELAYINTHGTGTPEGDRAELDGIRHWLGNERIGKVPLSSTKSYSGHLLGAAGVFELALCVMMFERGYILPNWGLSGETVDPEFGDFNLVMGDPQPLRGEIILSNSFGFGGANASVALKKPDFVGV